MSGFTADDFDAFGGETSMELQVQELGIPPHKERVSREKQLFAEAKARMLQKLQEDALNSSGSETKVGYGAQFARY
ncbi:hypothetical protein SARC_12043 [Sphaeroforma arctica JP610]|uniref:Uncharacterized protein n=1 Tax=Sphaeroforma arctica JP610 TaxID=667725 RepID=A0A0L0FFA0_9EUKA|nr:hypothetical protein SARC_12043 [Sphaeroforma arctica JP610]KNC75430.1 hypothetical protein SARC_12043 [Sphaeroforma arctica JP610]|eukprot:XP_014149332.1 hypothetical protein SARC_12043 [Sphaeroforma arctica JP610]